MQDQKESRSTASCTECQRRKQKCSREWPCNHCQTRKVPHLCQFGPRKNQQLDTKDANHSRGQKRGHSDSEATRILSREDSGEDQGIEDGLKAWGYMPGHVHYKLGDLKTDDSAASASPKNEQTDEVERALRVIPTRSITDTFVNHFLNVVNYRYNTIYAPTFTDQYVQWWADRISQKRVSPEFTCLLLRILAYTVQYLTPQLRKMIEFEMAIGAQVLAEQFGEAAEALSASFPRSQTSLERVQELFLKGVWLKSESRIVDSWHSLGQTIREAQELGIDKDENEGLSEFEVEIRRRIWTLLYVWDWQMSAWLSRPHLIDQKDCKFVLPTLRLDQSNPESTILSPFAHMALQAMLARRLAHHMEGIDVVGALTADQILSIEEECDRFIVELPAVFRTEGADLSHDEEHPYYVFQRCQLHVCIFTTQLDFLKPYLTKSPREAVGPKDSTFRRMGVDLALRLLDVARRLFDQESPINVKFHLVVFCIFDTATVLCSAIIHDEDKDLPRREDVLDAIESALDMLHQTSLTTKLGASSYNFLFNIVQAAPGLSKHAPLRKRRRVEARESEHDPVLEAKLNQSTVLSAQKVFSGLESDGICTDPGSFAEPPFFDPKNRPTRLADPVLPLLAAEELPFNVDLFLQQNPFGSDQQLDIGGLEQVWDWDSLNVNLDGFSNSDHTMPSI